MENPKPTEQEQELQGTERHRAEEAMRGGSQHEELPLDGTNDDGENDDRENDAEESDPAAEDTGG
jgi:hypothetical protein